MVISKTKLNKYLENSNINLRVKKKLGEGAYGTVFKGIWEGRDVAVKVEESKKSTSLKDEVEIYDQLHESKHTKEIYLGIPKKLFYHSNEKTYRILVLPLYGKNLADIVEDMPSGTLSPKTVAIIAKQVVSHLRYIHSTGIVNLDIKPENLMVKSEEGFEQALIYMVDFGMSRKYRDRKGNHIKNRKRDVIEGTIRYMGINTHLAEEASRRDDFQALAYTLIFLLKGRLPWQGLRDSNNKPFKSSEKREQILNYKKSVSTSELCLGLPSIFEYFLKYGNSLKFDEPPNYDRWEAKFFEFAKAEEGKEYLYYDMDWMHTS